MHTLKRVLLISAVIAAVPVTAGTADAPRRCAPQQVKLLASNQFVQAYRQGPDVVACGRRSPRIERFGDVQDSSVAVAGGLVAAAEVLCSDEIAGGCDLVYITVRVAGRGPIIRSIQAQPDRQKTIADITASALHRDGTLAWIVCPLKAGDQEGGGARTSSRCRGPRRFRQVYARVPTGSEERIVRVAAGPGLDSRYIRISSTGRSVFWKRNGRQRRLTLPVEPSPR